MSSRFLRFLPVVERELRLASRGSSTYRWRSGVVGVGLAAMALLTGALSSGAAPPNILGQSMFVTLVAVSSVYALLAGLVVTADTLSREKREGTLGLLFLTDLRGFDVVLGKIAASSLNTVYGLVGLLPLIAIPVMLGGVTIGSGVLSAVSILNLLFVSLSLGIAVSALSWDERRAAFASLILGLCLALGPISMSMWFSGDRRLAIALAACSPLAPLTLTATPTLSQMLGGAGSSLDLAFFGLLLLPSHLLGWGFLVLAGRWSGSVWHSRGGAPVRRTVDERVFNARDPAARARARKRLLDVHPLVWLLERHPGKRYYADGLAVSILAIWFFGFRSYGTNMFGGPTWFLIVPLSVTIHLVFAAWVVAESSMRWIQDRRSGALELLLCTSLTDRDLIRGHELALRRLFLRPVVVLILAEVFVAFFGFDDLADRDSIRGCWMMLALAWAVGCDLRALSWIGFRLAVSLPSVNRVGALALAITPMGPLVGALLTITGWNLVFGNMQPIRFGGGLLVWAAWVVVIDGVVGLWICRRWVVRELRAAACRVQPRTAISGG